MTNNSTIIDAPNSGMNKVLAQDSSVHDWYRFVLSYPPHLVRHYLAAFGMEPGSRVLDPFCGTGTTIVEAKKNRIDSVGVESHPMTHFASATKIDWSPSPRALLEHAEMIAEKVLSQLEHDGVHDAIQLRLLEDDGEGSRATPLRTLSEEEQKLLLKDSISPRPLHKALVLADALAEQTDPRVSSHERLALAKSLVFSSSNLNFGPEVGVGNPDQILKSLGPGCGMFALLMLISKRSRRTGWSPCFRRPFGRIRAK